MKRELFSLVATAGFALSACAGTSTFTVTPSPVAIPDSTYNGTIASMASVPLSVPISGTIQDVNVTLVINHTWIGDLVIKLRSPAGMLVTLMSRPGVAETTDDGNDSAGSGDSSNLSAGFPITFDASAPTSAENMGSTITSSQAACLDDLRCSYAPNPGAATVGSLASFNGQNAFGSWLLYVGDAGAGDTGTINQFSLTIVTPDAPPRLQIAGSGTNVVIVWPTNASNSSLEANQILHSNGWASVTNALTVSGTNFTVSLPATDVSKFFRLRTS